MSTSSPINPYESPRETAEPSQEPGDTETAAIMDLRRRVSELERRVSYSWVVHPNFLLRSFAVFGYWLVGYAILAVIGGVVVVFARLLFRFPD